MDKKALLSYIEELSKNEDFWSRLIGDNRYKKISEGRLGSSNIRSMVNISLSADCYEELRLYVKYKTSKGNGWEEQFEEGIKFGEKVIEHMDKIYESNKKDDKETLLSIAQYFGYMYWMKSSKERR